MKREEIISVFRKAVYTKRELGRNIDPKDPQIYEAMAAAERLLEHKNVQNESWPTNLLMEIGIMPDAEHIEELEENLIYTLGTLDKRESEVMLYYYRDGLSTQQILKKMGLDNTLGSSFITLGRKKALTKLRHRDRVMLICIGKDAVETTEELRKKYVEEIESMKQTVESIEDTGDSVEDIKLKLEELSKPENRNAFDAMDIDCIDFTIRSRNALKRGGYDTIGELRGISRKDLMRIRNMGEKSVDEIVDKLKEWGIEITG